MAAKQTPRYSRGEIVVELRLAIRDLTDSGWPENNKWRSHVARIVLQRINLAMGTIESFISTLCKEEWESLGLPPTAELDRPASARKTRQELEAERTSSVSAERACGPLPRSSSCHPGPSRRHRGRSR